MAVNDNGQVVAFVRERLRRRSEIIRALKVLVEDDNNEWAIVRSLVQNDTNETIFDDRDYINVLTGQDVYMYDYWVNQLLAVLQQQYAMDVFNKACIRGLDVTLGM